MKLKFSAARMHPPRWTMPIAPQFTTQKPARGMSLRTPTTGSQFFTISNYYALIIYNHSANEEKPNGGGWKNLKYFLYV